MFQNELKEKLKTLFIKNGFPEDSSRYLSDYFVYIEKLGDHAHSLGILPQYIQRIKEGGFNITVNTLPVIETSAFSILDANNTIGILSAKYATEYVLRNVEKTGIYTAFVRNANTYGVASYYTDFIASKNYIGISFSNTPVSIAPNGFTKKVLGTNPIAISIPSADGVPISFDMASSIISKSKLRDISNNNGIIPEGYALDENGNPTTSLDAALKGSILPFGGNKGFGIAMMIDLLSGLLSGAGFQNNVRPFNNKDNLSMNVGQVFIAIDPSQIYGPDFFSKVCEYKKNLKHESSSIYIPGEKKASLNQNQDTLIPLTDSFKDWLSNELIS